MTVGKIGRDLDPLPAFGSDRFGFCFQLLCHHLIDQRHVLQPAVVALEQVAQYRAAGGDIRVPRR